MLINIRTSELQSNTSNSIPLTIFIGIIISYFLFKLLPYDISRSSNFEDANFNQDFYILDISKITDPLHIEPYLKELDKYVYGMEKITAMEITKVFKKEKKLKRRTLIER